MFAFLKRSGVTSNASPESKPWRGIERLESRTLMSAAPPSGGITIGPPPTGEGPVAIVQTLSPSQTETGTPEVTVTVIVPDQAPPKPTETIQFNFVKIEIVYSSPNT